MVLQADTNTDEFLNRPPASDRAAVAELSARPPDRLRQMASVGLDKTRRFPFPISTSYQADGCQEANRCQGPFPSTSICLQ
jgi:hypothetical protein